MYDIIHYNLNLWFNPDDTSMIGIERSDMHKCCSVIDREIGKFLKLQYKKHNVDVLNLSDCNIIPVLCNDEDELLNDLFLITQRDTRKYPYTIVFFLLKEYVSIKKIEKIKQILKRHNSTFNFTSNIKIIFNAYKKYYSNKDLEKNLYYYNYFDKYLFMLAHTELFGDKHPTPIIKKTYPFYKERKYIFSTFTGQISGRAYRAKYIYKCIQNNIFNETHFWSLICTDYTLTLKTVQESIGIENTRHILPLLQHRVVREDGEYLASDEDIYYDHFEYEIPQQMLNSYINVVLETTCDIPSVTEKIYKPIIAGVPFLWHGAKNLTNFLQQEGYKLYPFIDYTFDHYDDPEDRLTCLIQEMKRLKQTDLHYHINSTKDISIHNRDNFFKRSNNMYYLYQLLKQ